MRVYWKCKDETETTIINVLVSHLSKLRSKARLERPKGRWYQNHLKSSPRGVQVPNTLFYNRYFSDGGDGVTQLTCTVKTREG